MGNAVLLAVALFLCAAPAVGQESREKRESLRIKRNGDGSFEINGKRYPDLAAALKDYPNLARTIGVNADGTEGGEPPGGPMPTDKERRDAATRALANLAERTRKGLTHGSGANGQVVTYAIAGLAFLASGSTTAGGPYAKEVAQCADFVIQNVGKMPNMRAPGNRSIDQTMWGYAHGAIFLAELYAKDRSPKLLAGLQRCCEKIIEGQTSEGGWCHGVKDEPNLLNYTTLNAVANLSLSALGLARPAGVRVPQDVVDRGIQYLLDSSDKDGGVGYSTRQGQKGYGECGRSCGALVAFCALDLRKHAYFPKLQGYLRRHLGQLETGHASPVMHILLGALACKLLGPDDWELYWRNWGRPIVGRQQADGSLRMPVDKAGEGEDRATATQTLVLCLPENRLTYLTPR